MGHMPQCIGTGPWHSGQSSTPCQTHHSSCMSSMCGVMSVATITRRTHQGHNKQRRKKERRCEIDDTIPMMPRWQCELRMKRVTCIQDMSSGIWREFMTHVITCNNDHPTSSMLACLVSAPLCGIWSIMNDVMRGVMPVMLCMVLWFSGHHGSHHQQQQQQQGKSLPCTSFGVFLSKSFHPHTSRLTQWTFIYITRKIHSASTPAMGRWSSRDIKWKFVISRLAYYCLEALPWFNSTYCTAFSAVNSVAASFSAIVNPNHTTTSCRHVEVVWGPWSRKRASLDRN